MALGTGHCPLPWALPAGHCPWALPGARWALPSAWCPAGIAQCLVGIARCPAGIAQCLVGIARCPAGIAWCPVPGRHCLVPGRHFSVPGAWQLVTFGVVSECHHHAKLLSEQPCSTSPALLCHCPLFPTHPALLPLPLDSTPNSLYIPTPVPARYLTLMVSMMLGRPQKMRMI
jgi:hypothetical protein